MRDLDAIFGAAAEAGRQGAAPLPPAQIRGIGDRVRRVRAATTATLSVAVVVAVVVAVTTAGVPNAAPQYIDGPAPTETSAVATPPSTPPTTSTTITDPPAVDPPAGILAGSLLQLGDLRPIGSAWVEMS